MAAHKNVYHLHVVKDNDNPASTKTPKVARPCNTSEVRCSGDEPALLCLSIALLRITF